MRKSLLWYFGFSWWEEVFPDRSDTEKIKWFLDGLKSREALFEMNLSWVSGKEQQRLRKQYARLQKQLNALIIQRQEGGRA